MQNAELTAWFLAFVAFALALFLLRARLQQRELAETLFHEWRAREMETTRTEMLRALEAESAAALDRWKLEHEKAIRQDAVERSRAVFSGKTAEHVVPYLPEFPFDPKDARFLGSPIDFVVFDGLSAGELREIVFVEVKSGRAANLSTRERRIRDAVTAGRVGFQQIRLGGSD